MLAESRKMVMLTTPGLGWPPNAATSHAAAPDFFSMRATGGEPG